MDTREKQEKLNQAIHLIFEVEQASRKACPHESTKVSYIMSEARIADALYEARGNVGDALDTVLRQLGIRGN